MFMEKFLCSKRAEFYLGGINKLPDKWQEVLFTNPSARAGYDTRSIFKRSLTGLNSEFFLLLD